MSKKKRKNKVWRCNHSCDLSTGIPCQHLEKLISEKPGKPSFEGTHRQVDRPIETIYYTSGAGFVLPEGVSSGRYEAQFRRKMKKAGLTDMQTDILTARFIFSDTFEDIAKNLGIVSATTVIRFYSEALKTIKKRLK